NSLLAYVTGCTPPRTGSPTDLLPEDLDRNDEAGIYPIFLEQPPLRPVRLESLESFLDRSRKLRIAFLDRDADLDSGVEGERALERIPILPHDLIDQNQVVHGQIGAVVLDGSGRRWRVRIRRDLDRRLPRGDALLALIAVHHGRQGRVEADLERPAGEAGILRADLVRLARRLGLAPGEEGQRSRDQCDEATHTRSSHARLLSLLGGCRHCRRSPALQMVPTPWAAQELPVSRDASAPRTREDGHAPDLEPVKWIVSGPRMETPFVDNPRPDWIEQ